MMCAIPDNQGMTRDHDHLVLVHLVFAWTTWKNFLTSLGNNSEKSSGNAQLVESHCFISF